MTMTTEKALDRSRAQFLRRGKLHLSYANGVWCYWYPPVGAAGYRNGLNGQVTLAASRFCVRSGFRGLSTP